MSDFLAVLIGLTGTFGFPLFTIIVPSIRPVNQYEGGYASPWEDLPAYPN
jgi:hypothetical protein